MNNATETKKILRESSLKAQIEDYWDERSSSFSMVRRNELAGPSAAAWESLILEHLPENGREPLKILDIGTGAGFFAIILARLGHQVTGIDMSAGMIHEAKQNALAAGCRAKFRKMDAQELALPSESFDAVISRNLTWTLPDAMQAYREWTRVLKKGGCLLNFDSDYGTMAFSKQGDQKNVHANIEERLINTCTNIKDQLRISTHRRPAWDMAFLQQLGLSVSYEPDISSRVHIDPDMHYDHIALFGLYAQK